MKKKILLTLVTLVLVLSIVLSGCAASGVAQDKYDQVVTQLADSESRLTQAQNEIGTLKQEKTALQDEKAALDSLYQETVGQLADVTQQYNDIKARYEYTGLSDEEIAEKIVENYRATHLYEEGVYDCNNMASDVWNMLKARGIDAVIVVGSVDYHITDILQSDHAWVLAEVAPGEYLALDATIGRPITNTPGSLYYQGWTFATPAGLKANDDLKTEYNARVGFVNLLVAEVNNAQTLYNNSSTQAEADKWLALYTKLKELKDAQVVILNNLEIQINQLATPL